MFLTVYIKCEFQGKNLSSRIVLQPRDRIARVGLPGRIEYIFPKNIREDTPSFRVCLPGPPFLAQNPDTMSPNGHKHNSDARHESHSFTDQIFSKKVRKQFNHIIMWLVVIGL